MPDDDWALSNHTVEFRQEERKHIHGEGCIYTYPDCDEDLCPPLSFCTETPDCQDEPDAHLEWCPVEREP